MTTNTTSLEGRSFTELLAMIRIGHIDMPVTVLTVVLEDDLIMVDHGDIDVIAHESHTSIDINEYASASALTDVIAEGMAHWGTWPVAVWFAGERVHFSDRDAVDPLLHRKGGTGENN